MWWCFWSCENRMVLAIEALCELFVVFVSVGVINYYSLGFVPLA